MKAGIADLMQRLPGKVTAQWPAGERFTQAFAHGSMSVELYAPAGVDPQTPHQQDELYFVQSGSGTFLLASEELQFQAGDCFFVPAGVEHRFTNFTSDFVTWVVFWGPKGGESARRTTMINKVGDTEIKSRHRLSCHCGTVVLELELPDGIVDAHRCDCSICRRKGAITASVPLSALKVIQGAEALKLYQFNTRTAKHYFCSNCGIYTHHQRRSNPHQYAYNVGCLEGVNPFELGPVPTSDGVNHPSDRPHNRNK